MKPRATQGDLFAPQGPISLDTWQQGPGPCQDAGTAVFSPCRTYRYLLGRAWRKQGPADRPLVIIGLNPSTADEKTDDPTIRRCIDFAQQWGHAELVMLNLFAYRSTDPTVLKTEGKDGFDVVGPETDRHLLTNCRGAGMVLAAWGVHGVFQGRSTAVYRLLTEQGIAIQCLGISREGHPRHPLYMPKISQPRPFIHP